MELNHQRARALPVLQASGIVDFLCKVVRDFSPFFDAAEERTEVLDYISHDLQPRQILRVDQPHRFPPSV